MRRRLFVPETDVSRDRRRRRSWAGGDWRPEALEGRQLLAIITVNTTADVSSDPTLVTLRDAINQANSTPESDTINFSITGPGVKTFQPATPLPTITAPVFLDGTSQGTSSTPLIEIDGSLITTANTAGLTLSTGTGSSTSSASTLRGLDIHSFTGPGVLINGAGNIALQGNFIGTNPAGTAAQPNAQGVSVVNSASNTIGGLTTTQRNLISGNTGDGIKIVGASSMSNIVQGNYIGVDVGGSTALANGGNGVLISGDGSTSSGARNNTVGGTLVAARNIISGNAASGVLISDPGAAGNAVQGNYIGLTASGTSALPNAVGVGIVNGASGNSVGGFISTARNVISGNTQAGVRVDGSVNNLIAANAIGTNADASAALPGGQQSQAGIVLQNGANSNTIGGLSSATTNIISGNSGAGVWIRGRTGSAGSFSSSNAIQGNDIGTNSAGTTAVPNIGHGVVISEGATNNTIGSTSSSGRNVISGNDQNGVLLSSYGTTGTQLIGNLIGTAIDGTTALGNGLNGVLIDGASDTTIGGTVSGAPNTIAFNKAAGVSVNAGNSNTIRSNPIFSNTGLGIDLGATGITPNDPNDPDIGPNLLQNFPIITSATTSGSTSTVSGTLNSRPKLTYTIDFYSTPNNQRESRTYLGSTTVIAGSDGNASFSFNPSTAFATGQYVTATATDSSGDTSEFSAPVQASAPTADLSVTQSLSVPTLAPANTAISGGFVTYTIIVKNNGPNQASGVTLADTLPTGATFVGATASQGSISLGTNTVTLSAGSLATQGTATLTLTLVAPSTVPSSGTITNTATATLGSGQVDPNQGNSTSALVSSVITGIDLAATLSASPNPATTGQNVAIILTITNNSTQQATNVVVTQNLPNNFNFVSADATAPITTTRNGQQLTIRFNESLPPAQSTSAGYSARVTIVGTPTAAGTLVSSTIVRADQGQTIAGDNSGFVPIFVTAAPISSATGSSASSAAPTVTNVTRVGSGRQATQLVVAFDQALQATTAQNLANYRLVAAGADGRFGTRDDVPIRLSSAAYNAANNTVTLTSARPYSQALLTRLTINGTSASGVTGASGQLLDGNGDSQTGGDYVAQIRGTGIVSATALDTLLGSGSRLSRFRRNHARG